MRNSRKYGCRCNEWPKTCAAQQTAVTLASCQDSKVVQNRPLCGKGIEKNEQRLVEIRGRLALLGGSLQKKPIH